MSQENTKEEKEKKYLEPEEKISQTQHSVTINGHGRHDTSQTRE